MQLEFQQSFLFMFFWTCLRFSFNSRVPHISVVCRGVVVGVPVNCSDSSSSSPSGRTEQKTVEFSQVQFGTFHRNACFILCDALGTYFTHFSK